MTNSVTQNTAQNTPHGKDWLQQLGDVITDPIELLHLLKLDNHPILLQGQNARHLFPLRVPRAFVARMQPADATDPLLLQVLTSREEFITTPGFITDPLDEQDNAIAGLLHKYHNRVLLLIKGGCAVNCRYCFRRHFPYQKNKGNKTNWTLALDYIRSHAELNEVIFSGGDPLMAKDSELDWLISKLEGIPHIKRLRIHTRLPVVIPERITPELCHRLGRSSLKTIMVTHINHANEIDPAFCASMAKLREAHVTLLNQSVLLRGINDNEDVLVALSNTLFDAGILPYYLHVLDRVQGAAHFLVDDDTARKLMVSLLKRVSGYLVPRLIRETGGKPSKIPLDLRMA